LGIPSLEDKIVQMAAARILESIYEADFSDRSIGYRKNQPGAREASYQLLRELNGGVYGWVVEADIKSFFDEVDHDWVIAMLEQRIDDRAFTGLIKKWLKAGILEPGESVLWDPHSGTPQGGIISPILANIYLHYVLDLWIEKNLSREYSGEVMFIRYADDIIVGLQSQVEAEDYLRRLPERLGKFNLRLAEEKSSLVKFQHWRPDQSGRFTFLGFDFYWARTRKNKNHRVVKRRTNKKKYQQSLQKLKDWIKESRSWPLKMILSSLRKRLRGYWNYYCVIGNSRMTGRYLSAVKRLIYKWLNRRSQRKSFGWTRFAKLWHEHWKMPEPRIIEKGRPLYGTESGPNQIQGLFD
jgi:group II intron reverse transcriptase/maturase